MANVSLANHPDPVFECMDTLSKNPQLFDRRRRSHEWEGALAEMEQSPYPENVALAGNWRMDHRVDDARESELKDTGCFPASQGASEPFEQCIRDYTQRFQCLPSGVSGGVAPGYRQAGNDRNRIPRDTLAPNQQLVHVASLHALLRRTLVEFDVQQALYDMLDEYPPEAHVLTPADVDAIANGLINAGRDAVKTLAGILSDHLGPMEAHWWAAFAHELKPYLATDDYSDVARILGLGHLREGDWLITWRYSPEVVGPLYRPSVAEADRHGYHFPSPPKEPYGLCMPLDDGLPVVKELIHAPLKGDVSEQACTGLLAQIRQPVVTSARFSRSGWLHRRREQHSQALNQVYSETTEHWLARHGLI